MRKVLSLLLSFVAVGALTMGAANLVSAQESDTYDSSYDYTYDTYDYNTTLSAEDTAALAGMGTAMIAFYCCIGIVFIVISVFWVMSLIHCIQNAPEDQKTLWILLIVLVPFCGIIYHFTKRKQWSKAPVAATSQPVTQQ